MPPRQSSDASPLLRGGSVEASAEERAQLQVLMDVRPAQAIAVLNHLGVADLLADGPIDVAALAAATGTHAMTLYRLLRYVAMHGVFTETSPRFFALTPMASLLRSGAPGSVYWRVEGDVSVKPWLPWEEWLETVHTGEPAYERMHGRTYWEALVTDQHARKMFDLSLRLIGERQIPEVLPLLEVSAGDLVVDVGCGEASWLAAILDRHPGVQGVAVDLEQAGPSARRTIEHRDLSGRASFVAADFFEELPAGNVLLLANVLHDWPDDLATEILATCQSALLDGGRVVIVERVLPEGDEPHHGKSVDINMLFLLGGRERTLREFQALLRDAGLRFDAYVPTKLPVGVIVASRNDLSAAGGRA